MLRLTSFSRTFNVQFINRHMINSAPSSIRILCSTSNPTHTEKVKLKWILKDGTTRITDAPIGMNIMRIAHMHEIELEGACEASSQEASDGVQRNSTLRSEINKRHRDREDLNINNY
eukprot:gene6446-8867_t